MIERLRQFFHVFTNGYLELDYFELPAILSYFYFSLRVRNNVVRSICDEIRGVWIVDETLSRVFDTSSQSKQKLRNKLRCKIVTIYAN